MQRAVCAGISTTMAPAHLSPRAVRSSFVLSNVIDSPSQNSDNRDKNAREGREEKGRSKEKGRWDVKMPRFIESQAFISKQQKRVYRLHMHEKAIANSPGFFSSCHAVVDKCIVCAICPAPETHVLSIKRDHFCES